MIINLFQSLFVSEAFAQNAEGSAAASGSGLISLMPFVLIFGIMYMLIIRPQQKRARETQEMTKAAKRGDVIVTSGGVIGKITKTIDDAEVEVEIAANVRVRLLRAGIAEVRAKAEA